VSKTPKDVFEEKPVTLAEVKDILKKRESEGELTYVQQVTLDYVNKFCKYSIEDAQKLKEELLTKFKISEITAIQIVNLSTPPTSTLELNLILDKEPTTLTEDQKSELVALVKEYAEKAR
jgi:DNA-directed RNA polymerase subunit F